MRLAAQMKGGFYPAHEEVIANAATFLRSTARQSVAILDPCAGEGAAIKQLAQAIGCPADRTFAIELDESRSATLHTALPNPHVLTPANFFGCRASMNSFSFIWLNPPFDDGYGRHRVEQRFLVNATDWLMPGAVMAFVCPEDVVDEYSDARRHFMSYYQDCQIVPFPEKHRRFKEVIVFGRKRIKPLAVSSAQSSWESSQAPPGTVYDVPPATGPRSLEKVEPTEVELQRMLANSPLHSHLTLAPQTSIHSPPLALGIGHVALLLASGQQCLQRLASLGVGLGLSLDEGSFNGFAEDRRGDLTTCIAVNASRIDKEVARNILGDPFARICHDSASCFILPGPENGCRARYLT